MEVSVEQQHVGKQWVEHAACVVVHKPLLCVKGMSDWALNLGKTSLKISLAFYFTFPKKKYVGYIFSIKWVIFDNITMSVFKLFAKVLKPLLNSLKSLSDFHLKYLPWITLVNFLLLGPNNVDAHLIIGWVMVKAVLL